MTTPPNDPLTRAIADRLLDGSTTDAPQLGRLLRAAAAPAAGSELAREQQVLAAFRRAQHPITPTRPRRLTMIKSAIVAALSAKTAAAAAVAAAATGGIALAAAGGVLPTSHTGAAHPTSTSSHAPESSDATGHAPAAPSPSPNLRGLCTAYQAGATSNTGKAANNPAFSALASAAGGAGNIGSYCATVVTKPQDSSGHPSGKPTSLPSQVPTTHPSGKPTSLPNQVSTTHPTGAPSSLPTQTAGSHPTGQPAAAPTGHH